MPRFTVIIPCHNAEQHLTDTIRSVQAQSFQDWSMILIDDGSTDRTFALCKAEAAQDHRITAVQQHNSGPSAARNRGAAMAESEILAFLDADDLWTSDRLAVLDQLFCQPHAPDAAYSAVSFFETDPERVTAISRPLQGDVSVLDCLHGNPTCTSSNIAVTRAAFQATGGFDERLWRSEDLEWLVRLCHRHRLSAVPGASVLYRTSAGGLSSELDAMHAGWNAARTSAAALGISALACQRAEAAHLRYLARRALRLDTSDALRLALLGCRASFRGFFASPLRGAATLFAALAAPLIPRTIKRRLFA